MANHILSSVAGPPRQGCKMTMHNIASARYSTDSTAFDAPVIAIRNGKQEHCCANDDIEGGGMLAYLAGGGVIDPFVPPAVTVDDVRAEAQRRIIRLVGASAITLNDIRHDRELTEQEQIEADYLRSLANDIKAIRAASNAFGDKIPEDYKDDKYW